MVNIIIFSLIIFFNVFIFLYYRRKYIKVISGNEIKDEIESLITEFNKNAEQNIYILEEKIKTVRLLITDLDKRILNLNKKNIDIKNNISVNKNPDKKDKLKSNEKILKYLKQKEEISYGSMTNEEKIIYLYKKGISETDIAKKLKLTVSHVKIIIKQNKLQKKG